MLIGKGYDPHNVLVLRHRPTEPELRKVLPWLAAERPEVLNAYQQKQGERLERMMKRGGFVASFIGHEAAKALFVGCTQSKASRTSHVSIGTFRRMQR